MNIAKISTKGQVTLPIEVRRKLNLNEGDHLLIAEENGRYYIDNAERVQSMLSRHSFANTPEDVETKLDEADRQAAESRTRYSADEVFDRVKRNIRAGA
ncbi:MAG: AbrB/MazE/SpoVT family DNA-binding domain-containing protein [Clostridia bacterium]|nr:AbrB/MazE/SpoVT family DNA-binding domain-containing protein [Clostridia bacterium]